MKSAAARTIPVSAGRALGRGAHAVGGVLYDAIETGVKEVVDLRAARALTGRHNWQNAAAAYAAARAVGIEPDAIAKALLSFPGLEHRMEEVARVGEVGSSTTPKPPTPRRRAKRSPPLRMSIGSPEAERRAVRSPSSPRSCRG